MFFVSGWQLPSFPALHYSFFCHWDFFFFFNFPKASEVLSSYQWPFFSCSDSERTIQEFNNVQDWYLFFLIDPCLSVENSSFVAVEESFLSKHELMMSCVLIKVFDLFLLFLLLSFHLVWEMKDFFFSFQLCLHVLLRLKCWKLESQGRRGRRVLTGVWTSFWSCSYNCILLRFVICCSFYFAKQSAGWLQELL